MMTGIPNVNKPLLIYQIITLILLLGFAIYDYRHHKVRNAALLAFLPWCLFAVPVSLLQNPLLPLFIPLFTSVLGFLSGGLLLLTISMATNGGIGGGDIKLTALLGLCYGTTGILTGLTAAAFLALIHLGIRKLWKKEHSDHIAFVPYLTAGCGLVTLLTHCL